LHVLDPENHPGNLESFITANDQHVIVDFVNGSLRGTTWRFSRTSFRDFAREVTRIAEDSRTPASFAARIGVAIQRRGVPATDVANSVSSV
jgi:hypothetical protein